MPAVACPACGSALQTEIESIDLDEQHRHYAPHDAVRQASLSAAARRTALEYSMRRCTGCGLEWADPLSAPDSDWYGLAYSTLDLYPGSRWEFDFVATACNDKDRVFDIGCGNGAFIEQCVQRGLRCGGADFASGPVAACRARGLEVQLIDLEGGPTRTTAADATVVTAFQVLEHLAAPGSLFGFAHSVAAADAVLWVAIPSGRRPSRVFGERDYLDQPPHHLTRWSEPALRNVGERHGWKLERVHYEPLPTAAALWWIATRTGRAAPPAVARDAAARRSERWSRWSRYPGAWLKRTTRYRHMTGFSMLARFCKLPQPSW